MAVSDLEMALAGQDSVEEEPYEGPFITLSGRQFRVADRVGGLAIMRFAKLAQSEVSADSMEGLAAMYDLIRQTVHPEDWQAFEAWADECRADADDLLEAAMDAVAAATRRGPTKPSDSSGGQSNTRAKSVHGSSSLVIAELEGRGRPDLALFVAQADQARATTSLSG